MDINSGGHSWLRSIIALGVLMAVLFGLDRLNVSSGVGYFSATPLIDFGPNELYLDTFPGLLYDGSNTNSGVHHDTGLAVAANIQPLDFEGNPDPAGKIVVVGLGMSNFTMELCKKSYADYATTCDSESFIAKYLSSPYTNHNNLEVLDCAIGGQSMTEWLDDSYSNYTKCLTHNLAPRGLSEKQVQVVLWKNADRQPLLGLTSSPGTTPPDYCLANPSVDACVYESRLGQALRYAMSRYQNLEQIFLHTRIYGGYASLDRVNPEPYAYETGFATKWFIAAQARQMETGIIDPIAGDLSGPWIGWGPYFWASGTTPRSDGLTWETTDFTKDKIHPNLRGVDKVSDLMMNFFLSSPYSPWFLSDGTPVPSPTPTISPTPTPTPPLDSTPPTVSIISPDEGSIVSPREDVIITTTASDDVSVTKVDIFVNNKIVCSAFTDGTGLYSCIWSVPSSKKGTYKITAQAYDSSGNTAMSSPVTVSK